MSKLQFRSLNRKNRRAKIIEAIRIARHLHPKDGQFDIAKKATQVILDDEPAKGISFWLIFRFVFPIVLQIWLRGK